MDKPSFANPEFEEQLMLLRGMTEHTQILHDAQVLQLKMWPLALFTHARGVELQLSFDKKEIDFKIKVKGKAPDDLQLRFENLDKWTKWLLGPGWVVRVWFQNKRAFRSGRLI